MSSMPADPSMLQRRPSTAASTTRPGATTRRADHRAAPWLPLAAMLLAWLAVAACGDTASSGDADAHADAAGDLAAIDALPPPCDGPDCCAGDQCAIDGACFDNDAANPDNPCEVCLVVASATSWSANDAATCDDGDACTLGDRCLAGVCVTTPRDCSDGNVCTSDTCDAATGACASTPNTAACDDGNACTQGDFCADGACRAGVTPASCDDANPCTAERCDPQAGCVSEPDDRASCDDGLACTDADACVAGRCTGAVSPACDDDNVCTADGCGPDGCVHTPLAALCDDGNPCTDASCDPLRGCVYTQNNASCDDGDACTAADACDSGACRGAAVAPDDGNACTDDLCAPSTGPYSVPHTRPCDDGDACTVGDACADGGCVPGAEPRDCDDGLQCTTDECDPASGCVNAPREGTCDDGNLCTAGDTCADGACVGTASTCDDGRACTIDVCDPVEGCSHRLVVSDGCRPHIVVDTPERAATVTGAADRLVTVAGTIESPGGPIASFTINGTPVAPTALSEAPWRYSFSHVVAASVGNNTLAFRAVDDLGAERLRVQSFHWSTAYTLPGAASPDAAMVAQGLGIWLGQQSIDDGAPPPPTDLAALFKVVLDRFDLSTFFDPSAAIANAAGFNVFLTRLAMTGNSIALEAAEGGIRVTASLDGITGDLTFDCNEAGCEVAGGDGTGGLSIDALTIDAYLFIDVGPDHRLRVDVEHARTQLRNLQLWADDGWTDFLLSVVEPFIVGDLVADLERDLNGQLAAVLGPMVGDALNALAFNLDFALPRLDGGGATVDVHLASDFAAAEFRGDGVLTRKATYEMGIALLPSCAPGVEYDAGLCYPYCDQGYDGVGPVCWSVCPAGTIDDGAFCRIDAIIFAKDSYGRGAGTVPSSCGQGKENSAGLCYPVCAPGTYGEATRCYTPCDPGYVDDGLTCRRPPETRVGDCWSGSDCPGGWVDTGCFCQLNLHVYSQPFYDRGVGTIPSDCGGGQELDAGLCYPNCAAGYDGVGPVCWAYCPGGYTDDGAFCRLDAIITAKSSYGRGVGTVPETCTENHEFVAGLCYERCAPGFDTRGNTCVAQCPAGTADLGDACQAPAGPEPHGGAFTLRAGASTPDTTVPYRNSGVPMRAGCGDAEQRVVLPRLAPLEIAFADDTLNHILYAAWQGGMLEFPVDPALFAGVDLATAGVDDIDVIVSGMLAPVASDCASGAGLALGIGDLRVDAQLSVFGVRMDVVAYVAFNAPVALTTSASGLGVSVAAVEDVQIQVDVLQPDLVGFEPTVRSLLEDQLVPALTSLLAGGAPLAEFPLPAFDVGPSLGVAPGTLVVAIEPLATPPGPTRIDGNTIVYGRLR